MNQREDAMKTLYAVLNPEQKKVTENELHKMMERMEHRMGSGPDREHGRDQSGAPAKP